MDSSLDLFISVNLLIDAHLAIHEAIEALREAERNADDNWAQARSSVMGAFDSGEIDETVIVFRGGKIYRIDIDVEEGGLPSIDEVDYTIIDRDSV